MRPLVLAALAASALASPALAQSAPPEPALPHRQGLAMEMPKVEEDAALQAAIASTTRTSKPDASAR